MQDCNQERENARRLKLLEEKKKKRCAAENSTQTARSGMPVQKKPKTSANDGM